MRIRIGTRKSKLALWQANFIAEQLKKHFPDIEIELVKIVTKGDKILDVPLAKVGGKGLFVKEIEEAMLRKEIDIAVHSLKDVPTYFPEGLGLVAITEREDPRDAFLSVRYSSIDDMPEGAVLGTSSLRRKAQIMMKRKNLVIEDLRGNVDTRIRKLEEGQYDGIILAYAGLKRLGFQDRVKQIFEPDYMIPAVAQGFLGIEARLDDEKTKEIVSVLNHKESEIRAKAERAFLKTLEGGCQVPLAGYSEIVDGKLRITGFVSDLEGKRFFKDSMEGTPDKPEELGEKLAQKLLDMGAREVLEEIYKGEN
ncbi:hydroxymethylbilane synthase [Persephonella hydrogeniphila]|uniref:Porphobilinogen deaminase n=1 Tax=Persephonella hydrogeniphila TaxID=198703 RepID=A0A285NEJ6_9AQUI|nr:hydroxymethylbilane synthase [Persephonella hydrogeniphila]SNZ07922.1 hydroxymethylbilane synthase [Persephonella hydrogeniphila]